MILTTRANSSFPRSQSKIEDACQGCYCCGTCRAGASEGSTASYRVHIYGRYDRIRPGGGGIGSVDQPAAGCQEIAESGGRESGVYFVGYGSRVRRRWCNLDHIEGEGWSLLMKTDLGTTFTYSSPLWTSTQTLNQDDVSLLPNPAKYEEFNVLPITSVLAKWVPTLSGGAPFYWSTSGFGVKTALELFSTPLVITDAPTEDSNWQPNYFSSQDGAQLFSFAHSTAGASVRWGYRWGPQNPRHQLHAWPSDCLLASWFT